MDTCCFSHYCKGSVRKEFNYKDIRKYIDDNGFWAVISAYTLFEYVQNCTTPKVIAEVRDELMRGNDFWVLNINRLIGNQYTFEYGFDFLFEFGFDPDKPQEFKRKIDSWREKVYASLAPRIILLTQILAIIYVMIDEQREDGSLTAGTVLKLRYIDEEFAQNDAIKRLLDSFLYQHAKDDLIQFVDGMIKQMMSLANVFLEQQATHKFKTLLEYNTRVMDENDRIRNMYPRKEMSKKYQRLKKNSQGKFEINSMIDVFLKNRESIFKGLFKQLVDKWFLEKYSGKDMANTIIDFVNLGIVEAERRLPLIYITEEKLFVKIIQNIDEPCLKETKEFYKRYYNAAGNQT